MDKKLISPTNRLVKNEMKHCIFREQKIYENVVKTSIIELKIMIFDEMQAYLRMP